MTSTSDERTLYISNLDKIVSDEILYELFLQAGPIERVNIVESNLNATNYGFVTYKHEVSIEYALQIFKETYLFNKEISISKRGKNNGSCHSNEYAKHEPTESVDMYNNKRSGRPLSLEQMYKGPPNFRHNNNNDSTQFSYKGNNLEGNWFRNKPYDHGPRKHSSSSSSSSRSYDDRRRHKGRDPSNKSYHNRNKWY